MTAAGHIVVVSAAPVDRSHAPVHLAHCITWVSNETGRSNSPYDVRLRAQGDSSANAMLQDCHKQCYVRHDASLLLQLLHPTHSALSIQMSSKLVHTGGT